MFKQSCIRGKGLHRIQLPTLSFITKHSISIIDASNFWNLNLDLADESRTRTESGLKTLLEMFFRWGKIIIVNLQVFSPSAQVHFQTCSILLLLLLLMQVKGGQPSRWWSSDKNLESRGLPSVVSGSNPVVAHMMATRGLHGR